jgi:pSer/pThr/pTyr-binding forkhead associated (FHA) protein
MSWILTVTLTPRGGRAETRRVQTGADDTAWIGRASGNEIVIPNANLSRRHCTLFVKNGELYIKDSGSTNGIWVNGTRVDVPRRFGPGDRLYIGDYIVQVVGPPLPTSAWQVVLEVVDSQGKSRTVTAALRWTADDRHELTIGRQGDVVLDGLTVARKHCTLIINEAGGSWIADNATGTGTFVDGARIAGNTRLPVGTQFRAGEYTIRLCERPIAPPGHVDP